MGTVGPIGPWLKVKRLERGWTPGHLSIRSGVAVATIIGAEKGTNAPSLGTLTALCVALELTVTIPFKEEGNGDGAKLGT